MLRPFLVACLMMLAACAPVSVPQPLPDVLILGEQHDAPSHQRLHRRMVEALAERGELAGVALEMADAGHTTAGLAPGASEAQVKAALGWSNDGWPWSNYAPAIMVAVRAGVPVVGANLARDQLKAAGADASLQSTVSPAVLKEQIEDVREGHCGLLPESQLVTLARIQLARDTAFARAVTQLTQPGKAAVLITGARHADPRLGVRLHLPATVRSVSQLWPRQPPAADYCAQLRERFKKQ